jgi:Cellulase (glycosyl hydrolase family 5)
VAFIKSLGATAVRLPLNYRHFEDDMAPFVYRDDGFRRLDQALEWCARHGLYAILDLHAVQGWQNSDWHSDNANRQALLWEHRQFQDRFVALWEEFARHYRGNSTVAGYNIMNEPASNNPRGRFSDTYRPAWNTINALYRRTVDAIRAIDADHIIFLEGDYYSRLFSQLDAPFAPNLVYSSHNYDTAGFDPGAYPEENNGPSRQRPIDCARWPTSDADAAGVCQTLFRAVVGVAIPGARLLASCGLAPGSRPATDQPAARSTIRLLMALRSQTIRSINRQADALRMGVG